MIYSSIKAVTIELEYCECMPLKFTDAMFSVWFQTTILFLFANSKFSTSSKYFKASAGLNYSAN